VKCRNVAVLFSETLIFLLSLQRQKDFKPVPRSLAAYAIT